MSSPLPLRSALRFAALLALFPALAHAHPGHDGHELTWDFQAGFGHPFSGWDHLLAMLAVGLWSAQLGGRARWLLPTAFLGAMAIGACLTGMGLGVPAIEPGIVASVVVLGLLVAFGARLPFAAGAALVGLFAFFHGAAHGAEMPAGSHAAGYGLGFVAATALLHGAGIVVGQSAPHLYSRLTRYVGWAIAGAGIVLLAA